VLEGTGSASVYSFDLFVGMDYSGAEILRSLEHAARLRQAILKRAFDGRLV